MAGEAQSTLGWDPRDLVPPCLVAEGTTCLGAVRPCVEGVAAAEASCRCSPLEGEEG